MNRPRGPFLPVTIQVHSVYRGLIPVETILGEQEREDSALVGSRTGRVVT